MPVWRTTCLVCRRPTGRARNCPYCDEPLPLPDAGRQLWRLTAVLALAGALVAVEAAPAPGFSLAHWPASIPWLTVAGLLGAVSGLCHGVPLPVLLFAAGVPAMPCAAALGGYAVTSAMRLRDGLPTDPTALPFAANGSPTPPAAAVVTAVVGWLFAAVAALHPRACLSVVLMARTHGRWLLAAGLLTAALLARSGAAVPPHNRVERLRDQWGGIVGALVFAAVALGLGVRVQRLPVATLAAAAVGMFTMAPLLWRAVASEPPPSRPTVRNALADTAARSVLLTLLAVGSLGVADDPLPPLFVFASAATVAALVRTAAPVRRRLGGTLTRFGWLPSAVAIVWAVATSGFHGTGFAALAAALTLWGGLWCVPPVLALALWLPLIG